jgi:hypothetical protein
MLAISLLGLFALAPTAMAVTAAADQYGGGGNAGQSSSGGTDANGSGGVAGAAAGETTGGGSGSGSGFLPFSGYPLTPLILVVGGLVAAGLAVRCAPGLVRPGAQR